VGDEVSIRQTFARFDGDGDGKVSVAEFASLLQAVGCELTHHELEAAVAIVGDMSDRTVRGSGEVVRTSRRTWNLKVVYEYVFCFGTSRRVACGPF
jgi:hypothetical protein